MTHLRIKSRIVFSVIGSLTALATLTAPAAHAEFGLDVDHKLYFGAGLLSQDAFRLSSSNIGATSATSALFVELALSGRLRVGEDWGVSPLINYTPLGHKSAEGGEKSTLLAIGLRFFKQFGRFDLSLGPGLMMYKISGSGGTSSQSNGASGVPTVFGIPSSSVTSTLYYLDAGAGIKVTDEFRFELDGLVTGMFSARRAVNLVASLSYGFL